MNGSASHPTGIYETILYGEDLPAMERFYRDVVGLWLVSGVEERSRGFRVSPTQMLLIFRASETLKGHPMVPTHGTTGEGHVAFAIERGTYDAWKERLALAGATIEKEVEWPVQAGVPETVGERARSIYVRDPARNSVELVEGDLWPR